MRRALGIMLMALAVVIALLGVATAVQMVGHTDWWQVVVLVVLVLGVGYMLMRNGRRMRA